MNANPWSLPKDRALRRLLLSLEEQTVGQCDVALDQDAGDPRVITLRHPELSALRAHVYLHGQRPGTYGLFFEYPHPVPGMLETEENLPLPAAIASLAMHFDA
jgi:hypothetical protein